VFEVEKGSYSWLVSKTGYYSKSGSEYISSDKTINVCLEKDEKKRNGGDHSYWQRDYGCSPIWECSGWSECADGFKTRECRDLNYCDKQEVEWSKPKEKQACIMESGIVDLTGYSTIDLGLQDEDYKINWIVGALIIGVLIILLSIIILLVSRNR